MVARILFLLLLDCSAWPCLGPAQQDLHYLFVPLCIHIHVFIQNLVSHMGFITKSFQTPAFEACLADFVSLQLPQLHSGAPISYYPFVTRYPKSDYEPERSGKRVVVARHTGEPFLQEYFKLYPSESDKKCV